MEKGITLVGMPGSGKSTIGKRIAKILQKEFVDLDELIKQQTGEHHQNVLQKRGDEAFLQLEEQIVLGLSLFGKVFAPSGSIIYSEKSMRKIQKETKIFYLKVPRETIKRRLFGFIQKRGIVGLKEHGFDQLFEIRSGLYEKYAHVIVDTIKLSKAKITETIIQAL